jgi:hypothetical protein
MLQGLVKNALGLLEPAGDKALGGTKYESGELLRAQLDDQLGFDRNRNILGAG